MKKELSSYQRLEQWMVLFLVLSPIFDLITSLSIHFTGHSMVLILGIKMLFLGFLIVQVIKEKANRKWIWYYGVILLYALLFLFFAWQQKDFSALITEAQALFRTFYFPLLLSTIALLSSSNKLNLKKKWLAIVLFEYLILILLPIVTKTGFDSYAYSKTGTIGWFHSTNEIGGIFAILSPIFLMQLKNRPRVLQIILVLALIFVLFSMGTKVPILAFILTILLFLGYGWIHRSNKQRKRSLLLALPLVLLVLSVGIFLLPKTSFYRNIQIHLDFLEIHSVKDLMTFDHIDHFIFSERLTFLLQTKENYDQSSSFEQWFGMGVIERYGTDQVNTKAIEMDYYDVFYHYGVVGTILFFLPLFLFPFWNRRFSFDQLLSLGFVFVLAFFSGHILVAPSVAFLVVWLLFSKGDVDESCLYDHSLQ